MTPALDLKLRSLMCGEERLWLGCTLPPQQVEAALPDFLRDLERESDPDSRLLAFDGERCVGRLRLLLPHARLCLLHSLAVAPGEDYSLTGLALLRGLRRRVAGRDLEAMVWESAASADYLALLLSDGFQVNERKLYVERSLEDPPACADDPFEYRSLEQVGEDAFIRVLAELEPAPAGRDPLEWAGEEFRDLRESAGTAFQPAAWLLAFHQGAVAGLLLPQLFPDEPEEGTLYWIGLLPAWRGRGLGRTLHAHGLRELARQGALRYLGSTALENEAMRRVFAANGCGETGVRLMLARADDEER